MDTGCPSLRIHGIDQMVRWWSRDGTVEDAIARLFAIGAGNSARALQIAAARRVAVQDVAA